MPTFSNKYDFLEGYSDECKEELLAKFAKTMEEMAGLPKEEHGKRQPGEMCSYEKFK